MTENIKYSEGGIGEFAEWEVCFDEVTYENKCRHCIIDDEGDIICPAVVVAKNEGGYNWTKVCLRCIVEANDLLESVEI